ncbi:MAG: branched-chain amino acid ABC transporter permease, partial [Paralcaligenes sp.]
MFLNESLLSVSTPASSRLRVFHKEALVVAVIAGTMLCLPLFLDSSTIGDFSFYLLWTFCGVGLAAMWGHCGILSFGQSAFIGFAGYVYGVLTLNFGEGVLSVWGGLIGSLLLAGVFAALLGYMIFYGRVTGIFVGIITLSVTLVLETFMAQTAGPEWVIGKARLNGFNGMSGMPPLSLPWFGGTTITLEGTAFFTLLVILLAIVYLVTQYILRSPFGLTLASIKENPRRAEMLGIDIRKYQLLIFVYGGVLAGLTGSLYTIWGS